MQLVEAIEPQAPQERDDAFGPSDAPFGWLHWGHGRGPLLVTCVLGLVSFWLPWVSMTAPERRVLSGADIAQRTGVTWAAFVAWFTLLPLVLSRRTVEKMRGARLAVAVLGAVAWLTPLLLVMNPPKAAQIRGFTLPMRYRYEFGIVAAVALGLIACAMALFWLGGPTPRRTANESHS